MNECIFCKIIEGQVSCHKIYEDEQTLAFLDANPASKGHTLVIPKKHVRTIHEAEGMNYMWDSIVKVSNAVKQAFQPKGFNITQNNGEIAGQEVMHMHFHITPRYTKNEIEVNYNHKELKNGEQISSEIREAL